MGRFEAIERMLDSYTDDKENMYLSGAVGGLRKCELERLEQMGE